MAAATTMPWPQQLLSCFGGKAVASSGAAPLPSGAVREDSAHQQHSGSSGMRNSDKSSFEASSDGPGARMALSEPAPCRKAGPAGSMRSPSMQAQRRGGYTMDLTAQQAGSRRRSGRHQQADSPAARAPDDWHNLKRFAYVGDICSNAKAHTVTKLMLNRCAFLHLCIAPGTLSALYLGDRAFCVRDVKIDGRRNCPSIRAAPASCPALPVASSVAVAAQAGPLALHMCVFLPAVTAQVPIRCRNR